MSLLKITTTPIEYELKIEHAKLRLKERDFEEIKREQAQLAAKQKRLAESKAQTNPQLAKQAQEGAKSSMNYQNVAKQRASGRVRATSSAAFSEKSSVGSFISDISGKIGNLPENIDFISANSDNDISCYDNRGDLQFDASHFVKKVNVSEVISKENQWTISKKKLEFVPGRFQMDIIQYPKVTVEYLDEESKE